ncbi:hypothetical protein JCM10450v2_006413 [Rhodotorula kratochvilovae]
MTAKEETNALAREADAAHEADSHERTAAPRRVEQVPASVLLRDLDDLADGPAPKLFIFGARKNFSTTPLSELQPIRFKEMKATVTHKGRYLLCRAIACEPVMTEHLIFVVEDQDGRAEFLHLHNYPPYGTGITPYLKGLYRSGTGFRIREPTFVAPIADTPAHIRVTSPTDVEVLSHEAPAIRDARWATSHSPCTCWSKTMPLDKVDRGRSFVEIRAHTEDLAAAESQSEIVCLTLLRAIASFVAARYAAAYRDLSIVQTYLDMSVPVPKGRAPTQMMLLDRARDEFDAAADEVIIDGGVPPGDGHPARDIKDHIARITQQIEQAETGEFPWEELEERIKEEPVAGLNVGHYVGPIRVAQLKKRGGGRGVIATRDIVPGELLLVEKAFAVSNECAHPKVGYDIQNRTWVPPSRRKLVAEVAARIMDDPSVVPLLKMLYDGKNPPQAPLVFNAIGDRTISEFAAGAVDIDMEWVERICLTNALSVIEPVCCAPSGKPDERWPQSALFLNGSAFNHSCLANTYWRLLGDVLVVRARTAIKKGKEVYLSCLPLTAAPQYFRAEFFKAHFPGGCCPCAFCVDERRDDPEEQDIRNDAVAAFAKKSAGCLKALQAGTLTVDDLDALAGIAYTIDSTYDERHSDLRPELVDPCKVLIFLTGRWTGPAADTLLDEWVDRLWDATGTCIELSDDEKRMHVVEAPLFAQAEVADVLLDLAAIAATKCSPSDDRDAVQWLTAAADLARIVHGDDVERFWRRSGTFLDENGLQKFKERVVEAMKA